MAYKRSYKKSTQRVPELDGFEWTSVDNYLPICEDEKIGCKVLVFVFTKFPNETDKQYEIKICPFLKNVFYLEEIGGKYYPYLSSDVTHWSYLPKHPILK